MWFEVSDFPCGCDFFITTHAFLCFLQLNYLSSKLDQELSKHRIYAPCLTGPSHTSVMALEGFLLLIINYEVVH